jgi:hypothetical protein
MHQYPPDIVIVGYFLDDLTGLPTDKPGPAINIQWKADGTIQMRGGSLRYSRLFNLFTSLADQTKYKNRSKRIAHLHDVRARQAEWKKYPLYEATEQFHPNYLWPLDGHTNEVGHQAITDALLPVVCENLSKRHISCRAHASSNS